MPEPEGIVAFVPADDWYIKYQKEYDDERSGATGPLLVMDVIAFGITDGEKPVAVTVRGVEWDRKNYRIFKRDGVGYAEED